jgi:uncharacterized repeat protein (TIGR02543 family)
MTLYAKWTPIPKYTVSFDVDGGSAVPAQTIVQNGKAVEPSPPTKVGHTFAGWYTDKMYTSTFDFANTNIISNTPVYAKW